MARAPAISTSVAPRRGCRLAVACAMMAAPGLAVGQTPSIDCNAVNRGALNVELAQIASATRSVALRPGETLNFNFRAEPGQFGSLTLLEGVGSSRVLLMGETGASASFAARGGSVRFRFAKEGEAVASFTATCVATRSARPGNGSPAPAWILRKAEVPVGDGSVAAEALTDPAIAAALDPDAPKPPQDSKAPVGEATAITPPKQIGGPEMKLQWREERYAGTGQEGLLIDANASGMDIGVSYKLKSAVTIGALAQFNPAAEMLFGGQRSLLQQGWMAGPVTTVQVAPGLVLDARAAWGLADTDPNDGGAAAAQRRLLNAKLASPQTLGAWRFTPSVNFSHLWETLPVQGPSPAEILAPHPLGSGRIDVGPELAYRMELAPSAFIEPRAALGGFWGFDSLAKLAPGSVAGHPDVRLKAEAGVTIGIIDGPKLQALGGVEEGGAGTPDAWTGRLQLSVPLK